MGRPSGRGLGIALALGAASSLAPWDARADPFEIQVYDATVSEPGRVGVEVHANTVVSGRRAAAPPELPPHHQSHLTLEPAVGLTSWWEVGVYVQTALLADGSYVFGGGKLRTKLVVPPRADSRFGWGVNVELARLPARFDADRWGGELRPIATWSSGGGGLYASINPIVDFSLAGAGRDEAPSFEPAATLLFVAEGVLSAGIEYYADLGPIGSWLPARAQEHYLFEVINVLAWKHLELNLGVGEGLTDGSNGLVVKMIAGFR